MNMAKTKESTVSLPLPSIYILPHTHPDTHTLHNCITALSRLSLILVRQKAKELISFIQDDERLKDARKQAKQTRDKFVGYSSVEGQHRYSESFTNYMPFICSLAIMCFFVSGIR